MDNNINTPDYIIAYREFLSEYKMGMASATRVGEVIVQMTDYFARYNLEFASSDIKYNSRAAEIESTSDPLTGKSITSTKAKIFSDASEESKGRIMNEAHVKNLDTIIQSLKILQKGLLSEFNNSNA